MSHRHQTARLAAAILAVGAAAVAMAQPANDNCSNATAISGNGTFNFTLNGAVTQVEILSDCDAGQVDIAHDVWFCWTANCTGQVTISTCGGTTVDTILALYDTCACPPSTQLCCADNTCGAQSSTRCDVQCGHQYLIRIADRNFGGPGQGGGTFTVTCEGTPCGGGDSCAPGECCGRTPSFTGFTGPVAVNTTMSLNPVDPMVHVIDLSNSGSAPLGSWWNTAPFYPEPTSWNRNNLGTVFGIALDGQGNIYVAHSSVYASGTFVFIPTADAVGFGGPGAIYKIASSTGNVSLFAALPNLVDPAIAGLFPTEAYPGIGNISVDCETGNLYASNFEDGAIYRVPLSGLPTNGSMYHHATDTIVPGIGGISTNTPGFAPLGQRIWAVQSHNGRLYYSIWATDTFRSVGPNTIWSIQLNGSGDFVAGSRRQENVQFGACQNPTSDLSFSPSGSMFAAQRSMGDPNPVLADTRSTAHASCLLEFVCDPLAAGNWNPSPNPFDIGFGAPIDNTPPSAAGGVDVDFRTAGRIWATGDAMYVNPSVPTWIYGFQGIPPTGNIDPSASILVDTDQDVTTHDKTAQGSIEVSCQPPCATILDERILCEIGPDGTPTGCFTYTFSLTNNSGHDVQYLLFPSPNISPNVIGPFSPTPFADGEKRFFTIRICGVAENTPFTVPIILMDTNNNQCCTISQPIVTPDCDCLQLTAGPTVTGSGPNGVDFTLSYQPLDFNAGALFLSYEPGNIVYTVTITPSFFFVNTPQYSIGTVNYSVQSNAPPGTQLCFRILIHTLDWAVCCSKVFCFTWPGNGVNTCPGDLNGDGFVDLNDLTILLSHFGMNGGATSSDGDTDGDGDVDISDLTELLSHFGTTCP